MNLQSVCLFNMSRALVSYALQKHIAAQIDTDKADKQASSD